MNRRQLNARIEELKDANEWAWEGDVKIDLNGVVIEIEDVEFDKERGVYFIKAAHR